MEAKDVIGVAVPATYFVMYAVERAWPAREFPRVPFWGLIGVGFLLTMLTMGVTAPLLFPVDWLARHRLVDGTRFGVLGGVFVGLFALQLFVYWYHRLCHRSPLLWRWSHQMHHAADRVDIPGSVMFHPIELVTKNVVVIGITVFILGLDPLAAAIVGYVLAFAGMFQHWNVRTPRWVGFFFQRPESHCHHHERGVHAFNYSDLPIFDIAFGTFKNPPEFVGRVGFESRPSFVKMLAGVDVSSGIFMNPIPNRHSSAPPEGAAPATSGR